MYKDEKDITVSVTIKAESGKVNFQFTADCGKHGTDEQIAKYTFEIRRLLRIFASIEVTEEELG